MNFDASQSITQIIELLKEEAIQKYQSFIDRFKEHGCKLHIEFSKQTGSSSKAHIYVIKIFILPLNMSKNQAVKNCQIKYFSGKLFKIKKKENKYYVKKYKDMLLPLYFNIAFFRLFLVGEEKFFNEGFLDLFVKIFCRNRIGEYSNKFKGHDISFIPIILFAVFMIILALINSYFDILISENLGWW